MNRFEQDMERDSGREVVRADSGCPGGGGRQEAVGEEEDRKEREGERLLFIVLLLLCHHQRCHRGRSGVGREGGEVELTSSTSWRSVRAYYHILPIKAFNSHIYAIKGLLMHLNNSWQRKKLIQEMLSPSKENWHLT